MLLISCRGNMAFSLPYFDVKRNISATIVADVKRFSHQINTDEVFGTHNVQFAGTRAPSRPCKDPWSECPSGRMTHRQIQNDLQREAGRSRRSRPACLVVRLVARTIPVIIGPVTLSRISTVTFWSRTPAQWCVPAAIAAQR
jgi:hypothetical protein